MPNPPVADHIANKLREGLTHPGDGKANTAFALPMAMFRATGMSAQMIEQFAKEAGLPHGDMPKLTGEAIVHEIEASGRTIVDNTDLQKLQASAVPVATEQRIVLKCNLCGNMLFGLPNIDLNNPTMPAFSFAHLKEQIAKVSAACPHAVEETQP